MKKAGAIAAGVSVALVGAGIWFFNSGQIFGGGSSDDELLGFYLERIEVEPRKATGKAWDADSSGPDVFYEVEWQGVRVFESAARKDTLIAEWSRESIGLGDWPDVSKASLLKIARVRALPPPIVRVWDDDLLEDDLIAVWRVPEDALTGDAVTFTAPAQGLVSLRLVPVRRSSLLPPKR